MATEAELDALRDAQIAAGNALQAAETARDEAGAANAAIDAQIHALNLQKGPNNTAYSEAVAAIPGLQAAYNAASAAYDAAMLAE